jgi:undecaprenyl-diphosphatase
MNNVQAVLLGALQGVSEFLPISSSGHLLLLLKLWQTNTPPMLLDISLHIGTLVALLIAFRTDLLDMLRHPRAPMWILLIAGTIPTVIIAILFQSIIESAFQTGQTLGAEFLMTGILLLLSENRYQNQKITMRPLGIKQALLIGCAQGAAILPALSRSGLTMAAAIGLGVERQQAVRFSFLLSIPAILGASLFALKDLSAVPQHMYPSLLLAMTTSAIFGYLAIRFLLQWVSRHSIRPFGYYTISLGILLLLSQWLFHVL